MSNQTKGIIFALLAVLGGGLYAIPYRLSLDTANALPVIWGVFLCAFLFSLPGAWLARYQTKYSWKIAGVALATSLAGVLGNYSICQVLEPGFPHTDGFADAKRGHYCHDPWLDVFERVCNSTNFYCAWW